MGLRTLGAFLAIPALTIVWAAAGDKPSAAPAEPRYDTATVANLEMVVVETREVAKGNPLAGTHVLARLESARQDSEPQDVYLAPSEVIKQLNLTFRAGDRVQVIGSKVKMGAATVILTRELRRSDTTLYLRDEKGEPIWKYLLLGSS